MTFTDLAKTLNEETMIETLVEGAVDYTDGYQPYRRMGLWAYFDNPQHKEMLDYTVTKIVPGQFAVTDGGGWNFKTGLVVWLKP